MVVLLYAKRKQANALTYLGTLLMCGALSWTERC